MTPDHDAPRWVRHLLPMGALGFAALLLLLPLLNVLAEAFAGGLGPTAAALADPDTLHAVFLTAATAALSVGFNTPFGVAAAWSIARHDFRGKSLLIGLIDLPFSISPVISGLVFVLIFGAQTSLGRWLDERGVQILFALPGMALATTFVTFPYVARELMPVMEAVGNEEEEAAVTLGASPWQTFRLITLPNVRWGLIYGILLCTARAVGEFGAVSVVSGRITGRTDTMSLRVEKLYQEYQTQAAFAVATLFLLLAVATVLIKKAAVRRTGIR